MTTRFKAGDKVVASIQAQGLQPGLVYEVTRVQSACVLGQVYSTYWLRHEATGWEGAVVNGHLLLDPVPGGCQ